MKQESQAPHVSHIASVPFFVQQINTRLCGFPCIDKHIKIVDVSGSLPLSTSCIFPPPLFQSTPEMTLAVRSVCTFLGFYSMHLQTGKYAVWKEFMII